MNSNSRDTPGDGLFVRCSSHRARKRLLSVIGQRPSHWSTLRKARFSAFGIYKLSREEWASVMERIPGLSVTHEPSLRECHAG